jgi:hypothetical protein
MLEHPKALNTNHSYVSENFKDSTMDNQQETKKRTLFIILKTNKKNKFITIYYFKMNNLFKTI